MKNILCLILLISVVFSVVFSGAARADLVINPFQVLSQTTDGRPAAGMFTHIRVMAMHGAPVFFCGEKPILYPCISWSGYDDTVKEFDVQADETGLAQVPEEKYSFSPLFWNTPRLELESTEDFNIAECGGRVSIYQIGDPGIIPNIPDGGCDSKDIEGENDLAHIPSKVDCPLAINSDELNRMIKLKKESCQRP